MFSIDTSDKPNNRRQHVILLGTKGEGGVWEAAVQNVWSASEIRLLVSDSDSDHKV